MTQRRLCLLLIINCLPFLLIAQKWTPQMYEKYSVKSFYKSKLAQQVIDPDNIDYKLLNAAIFYVSNEQRKKNVRAAFEYSPELEAAAAAHSYDMSTQHFFSHTSRVKGKAQVKDRLNLQGIENTSMGENIAKSFLLVLESNESYRPPQSDLEPFRYAQSGDVIPYRTYLDFAKDVVASWMQSPGHRKNLLNKAFTRLGCGTYIDLQQSFDQVPMIISTQNFSGEYELKAAQKD